MHPTPLRGPKIGAILKVGANWKAVAIYAAARVMRNPLGCTTCMAISMLPNLSETTWPLRLASESDVPALEALIPLSVRTLQSPYYSRLRWMLL
jgi:hypothetical protein